MSDNVSQLQPQKKPGLGKRIAAFVPLAVLVAGGVAANSALRAALEEECGKNNIKFYHPSPIFCTDNAAMIGSAGYYEYMAGVRAGWDLNAVPNLKLGEKSLRGRIDS